MRKTVFGIRPLAQCFILFGFGQEFSFWCIPNRYCNNITVNMNHSIGLIYHAFFS